MRYGLVIDKKKCIGCDACTIACKHNNGTPPGTFWCSVDHQEMGAYPNAYMDYTPILCMHCANAPCVSNCPTGASIKNANGIVTVDTDKCIGCRQCIVVCPYSARSYHATAAESYYPEMGFTAKEEAQFANFETGKVSKCNLCIERVAEGNLPSCVQTCPAGARTFGDLDDADSEVSLLIRNNTAEQLTPEFGTEPSVYYI